MKVQKKKVRKEKPPPPIEPDRSHREYRRGAKDYGALKATGMSRRMVGMLGGVMGIYKRPILPASDARAGWALYCRGFTEAREADESPKGE